ncbi:MAG: FAD-binding oxidoreductase [Thermoplasmata archaeon]|nr:MAG: FAD-binding oxidoreductase [Thermoplasmata archaeon]
MTERNVSLDKVRSKISKIVGDGKVKIDSKVPNKIIVRPRTSDDVSRIINVAVKEGVPIVPKRKITWAEKGAKTQESIILDTLDMNGIFKIDDENLAVTVGPGVLGKDLYDTLLKKGYLLGAYPVSSTPTVGEWVDIGGAGIGSYGHGFAGDLIRTMEVVLPDGKIINTGFEKVLSNSSGYNLNGLFVGADSTLGIITKITMKIFPKPEETRPLYYTFSELKNLTLALQDITKQKTTPINILFFDANHIQYLRKFGKDVPNIEGYVMNITLAGLKSVVDHEEGVINAMMERHGGKKESNDTAKALWQERFFEVSSTKKEVMPVFYEALIPTTKLFDMANSTYSLIDKMKLKAAVMGILCDRSTVNLIPYIMTDKKAIEKPSAFAGKFGELALANRGRPTGITMSQISVIKTVYGEGLNTILDIKSAIDPRGIMNPSKLS